MELLAPKLRRRRDFLYIYRPRRKRETKGDSNGNFNEVILIIEFVIR